MDRFGLGTVFRQIPMEIASVPGGGESEKIKRPSLSVHWQIWADAIIVPQKKKK